MVACKVSNLRSCLPLVAALVLLFGGGCTTAARKRELADYAVKEAVRRGNTESVSRRLDAGVDINTWRYRGYTMLHVAAAEGQRHMVEFLLERGANANPLTENEETPLSLAAAEGHTDVAKLLLAKGGKVNAGHSLYAAAGHGALEVAELLIKHGADVNKPAPNTMTPLHAAVVKRDMDIATLLVRAGANPYAVADVRGLPVTPLAVAEAGKDVRMTKLLHNSEDESKKELPNYLLEDVELMRIETGKILERAGRLVKREHPRLDLSAFEPGYVICLTHPVPDANPPAIIVEWLGKEPVAIERGRSARFDRKKVKKLQVRMTPEGRVLEIKDTFAWLYRAVEGGEAARPDGK